MCLSACNSSNKLSVLKTSQETSVVALTQVSKEVTVRTKYCQHGNECLVIKADESKTDDFRCVNPHQINAALLKLQVLVLIVFHLLQFLVVYVCGHVWSNK